MSARLFLMLALSVLVALPASAAGAKKKRRKAENREKAPSTKRLSFDMGPVTGTKVEAAHKGGSTDKGEALPQAGGSMIAFGEGKGHNLTNHRQLFQGPKDKLPPPSPGFGSSGGASGGNSITPNQPSSQ